MGLSPSPPPLEGFCAASTGSRGCWLEGWREPEFGQVIRIRGQLPSPLTRLSFQTEHSVTARPCAQLSLCSGLASLPTRPFVCFPFPQYPCLLLTSREDDQGRQDRIREREAESRDRGRIEKAVGHSGSIQRPVTRERQRGGSDRDGEAERGSHRESGEPRRHPCRSASTVLSLLAVDLNLLPSLKSLLRHPCQPLPHPTHNSCPAPSHPPSPGKPSCSHGALAAFPSPGWGGPLVGVSPPLAVYAEGRNWVCLARVAPLAPSAASDTPAPGTPALCITLEKPTLVALSLSVFHCMIVAVESTSPLDPGRQSLRFCVFIPFVSLQCLEECLEQSRRPAIGGRNEYPSGLTASSLEGHYYY